jgi:uncharacterized MAPEG superfamily protein
MSLELKLLAASIVLGFVHILLVSHAMNFQHGYRWGASSRDQPMPPLEGVSGRLERAARNFLETFPFFAAAVLLAHVTGRESWLTWWGANLYFWGRVAFLPLYASGVFLVRSLAWNVSAIGIFLILAALVF